MKKVRVSVLKLVLNPWGTQRIALVVVTIA
jgi:hypothetical protein